MQQSDRPSMIFMLNALRMSNFREQKRFFRPGSNCPINRNVANRKNNKRIGTPVFQFAEHLHRRRTQQTPQIAENASP